MSDQSVLIAAPDVLPALQARLASDAGALLAFADVEALRALEVITTTRPALVLLERGFAATPRGAALVRRIQADPALAATQIRIVTSDAVVVSDAPPASAGAPVVAAPPAVPSPEMVSPTASAPGPVVPAATTPAAAPPAPRAPELDYRGTRRAPRVRIAGSLEMMVDGNRGTLVDLSTVGAQLVTASVLKPNQRVRLSFSDSAATIRCAGTVVWASFEIPKGASPRYRVGVDFIDPDAAAIEAYQQRHAEPERT